MVLSVSVPSASEKAAEPVSPEPQISPSTPTDGRLLRFHLWAGDLAAIVALDEFRIRQTGPATLVVEIGGRASLTSDETAAIVAMIRSHAGDGFAVDVRTVDKIDWGPSRKRLGFHNEIL